MNKEYTNLFDMSVADWEKQYIIFLMQNSKYMASEIADQPKEEAKVNNQEEQKEPEIQAP